MPPNREEHWWAVLSTPPSKPTPPSKRVGAPHQFPRVDKDEVDESTIVSTYNVPQQNDLKKHHNIIEHRKVVSLASRGSSRITLRRRWPGGGWPRYGSGWHTIIGHHFFLDSGGGSALLSLYVCITRLQARRQQKGTQSVSAA